jgi:hypothetical protein
VKHIQDAGRSGLSEELQSEQVEQPLEFLAGLDSVQWCE